MLTFLLGLFLSPQSNWTILLYASRQNVLNFQQAYHIPWNDKSLYLPNVTALGSIFVLAKGAHRVLINILVLYTACMNKYTIIYSLPVWGMACFLWEREEKIVFYTGKRLLYHFLWHQMLISCAYVMTKR